jgi:hypothetical protein
MLAKVADASALAAIAFGEPQADEAVDLAPKEGTGSGLLGGLADAEALQAKPHVPGVLLERQEQDASPLRGEAQERTALGHGGGEGVGEGGLPHLHEGDEEGEPAFGEKRLPDPADGLGLRAQEVGHRQGAGIRIHANPLPRSRVHEIGKYGSRWLYSNR